MNVLHILKTETDNNTKALMSALNKSEGVKSTEFMLYDEQADLKN